MLVAPQSGSPSPPPEPGPATPMTASLEPVRAVIPERCYRRSTARSMAHVLGGVALYGACLAVLASTNNPLVLLPLWVVGGFAVAGMFVLGHDAAHGALFESKVLNRVVGTVLMLPSLHVFEAWVFGHNRVHHGYTVREGMDFVWHPITPEQYRSMGFWGRARHRLEWSWVGSGAYYAREVWWNKMMRFTPPARFARAVRRDWWLVVGSAVGVGVGVGVAGLVLHRNPLIALWLVVKVLVVPTVLFMHIIGWTVYVHHINPEIRWWPRREWNKFRGQVEGTTILRTPRVLNALFFKNIFVHLPHHVDMRIPFYELPRAAAAIKVHFADLIIDRKLRMRDYLATARACKLYDFDTGRWVGYAAARRSR
jgi:acyl-lipid omega-6 desaturase (Delta-12 desaturase)